MRLDQERLDDFQSRMNDWVSKQGFVFQFRYAGSVQGGRGNAFSMFLAIGVRLAIVILLSGLAFGGYLLKRPDLKSFRQGVDRSMTASLGCEELELRGLRRKRGQLEINGVNAIGGSGAFFEDLELRGVKMLMGLADGVLGQWKGDSISMQSLKVRFKGGAESDEGAEEAYRALFWRSKNFKPGGFRVNRANLQWGYSDSNRGSIVGARMIATRRPDSWLIVLRGGHFSQNWLQQLEIELIEIEIREDGWLVHEARLKSGEGTVGFTLQMTEGGAVPRFEGSGSFRNLPLAPFIGSEYRDFVDGLISGEFEVQGSTNSQTGFEMAMDVRLDGEEDLVELRDRLPILRAISTADRFRSYKKVRFRTGGFQLLTGEDVLRIENMALVAPRMMRLEGDLVFRLPTTEEIEGAFEVEESNPVGIFTGEESGDSGPGEDFDFGLRSAAEREKDPEPEVGEEDISERLGSILGNRDLSRDLNKEARQRQREVRRVDGSVRLGVLDQALGRTPALMAAYPLDEEAKLRWISFEFSGERVFDLTTKESEKVYEMIRPE